MDNFDWTNFVSFVIIKMKIVGLWPPGDDYKFNIYGMWSIFCIITFTFSHTLFQLFSIFFDFTDIETAMATVYITLSEILASIKACFIVKNMKILKKLFTSFQSDVFQPKNERQLKHIKPLMTLWKWNNNFFWITLYLSLFFWATYPIIDGSFKNKQLPFLAWYPYNTKISPYYELTYIYQMLGVAADGFTGVATDNLIAALHVYIASQFDILCDNLKNLHQCQENNVNFNNNLMNCIKHHRKILKFAHNSAQFTNWILLGQFFTSGLAIGITMFHMTTVVIFSSEFFSIISYLFSVVLQIFTYCYFGNEVEIKSSQIPYAVFESNWVDAPKNVKKKIIIMIERCRNPLKVSALNLFYLSLDTFMKILRVSWSYFALLHQVTSEK